MGTLNGTTWMLISRVLPLDLIAERSFRAGLFVFRERRITLRTSAIRFGRTICMRLSVAGPAEC